MGVKEDAYKYAIKNAYLHRGKASVGAVVGKVIALNKGVNAKEEMPCIREAVSKVNGMGFDEIEKEFMIFREKGYELKPKEKEGGLPKLDWAGGEGGEKVVTRYAPNPNGPFHLGNARAAILSHEYARMYNGKFILRFEDTDPKVKKPIDNAEAIFREDLEWLGCKIDEVYFASDRLEIYHAYMKKVIELGQAYVCVCDVEGWREKIKKREGCPCREKCKEEQMALFEKMLSNELKEGGAVLRIKTDLGHPDPSVRDWWAGKAVDRPRHNRAENKFHVWPSYNFQSAVDDHLMGVTYIIRGQEHSQNEVKQKFLYRYFGWVYPHSFHFGRVKLEGMVLSTSKIRAGIERGEYEGWDDPRLGTIRALRRKGFDPRALKDIILEVGMKSSDTTVEVKKLADADKKYIEGKSERISFIEEPMQLDVHYAPEVRDRGLGEGTQSLLVPREEISKARGKNVVRLRELYNVKIVDVGELQASAEYAGGQSLKLPLLTWIVGGRDVEIVMPDNSKKHGVAESRLYEMGEGDIVYLEKFGYTRVDKQENRRTRLWFTHK